MEIPQTMKAIKTAGQGEAVLVEDAPVPSVPEGYALLKVSHVALNPTDWKHLNHPTNGLTVGCDVSGTVVKVSSTAAEIWSEGDRVAAFLHGQRPGHPDCGCFAEYALAKPDLGFKVPASMNMADASTFPLGAATIGQALYQRLNIPWPDQVGQARSHSILIHGGSTVTGLLATQMAKLSGWHVLTTSSPHSFDLCRNVGADEVFDYNDVACVQAIRASTSNNLLYAFDCVGSPSAIQLCADALTQEKGRGSFVTVSPFFKPVRDHDDLFQKMVYAYTSEGETFHDYGVHWEEKPLDLEHAGRFFKLVQKLLNEGKIRSFPILKEGGLSKEGILKGLDDLKNGRVRGGKLVYRVS